MATSPNQPLSELSRGKAWGFRLLLAIGLPLVVLLGTEAGLRWAGYGYDTGFFLPALHKEAHWKENPAFGWRFFPKSMARAPLPLLVARDKGPSTIRIMVLGESAARGEPEPAFGFTRILEAMLRDQFPDQRFEIINTGVTAINSHAILPIAKDAAPFSPDFWVVYMGNNEFMGPFGPGTVFGAKSSQLPLLRASLALKSTRLGECLLNLREKYGRQESPAQWEGLEMFTRNTLVPDDPRLEGVYKCFKKNLEDILGVLNRGSGRTLLCTVGVNLSDGAPFASAHSSRFPAGLAPTFKQELETAHALIQTNRAQDALGLLGPLTKADDHYAEASFLMGRALLDLGKKEEARGWFQKACDADALRFRADSRINQIIRDTAAGRKGTLALVDVDTALSQVNSNGIPGDDLFLEHVHLTFSGNYTIAKLLAQSIGSSIAGGRTLKPWISDDEAGKRLGLTDWHRHALLSGTRSLLSRPPFTLQSSHRRRDAALREEIAALQPALKAGNFDSLNAISQASVARSPDDWVLLDQQAQLAAAFGRIADAATLWSKVEAQMPHHFMAWYRHGMALNQRKTAAMADPLLRQAIALRPDIPNLHYELAGCLAYQERFAEAEQQFAKALELRPDYMEAVLSWGLMLLQQKKPAEALLKCERAVEIEPNNLNARLGLTRALMQKGEHTRAAQQIREMLPRQPENTQLRFLLVDALQGAGDTNAVIAELRSLVQSNPQRVEARNRLAVALASRGLWDEAESQFSEIVQLRPEDAAARFNLGRMFFNQSRFDKAEEHLKEALRLQPTNQVIGQQLKLAVERNRTATPAK